MSFVYVFDTESRDILEMSGLFLLKEDFVNNMFVFVNDGHVAELLVGKKYVCANTLTYSPFQP